jgi:predicted phage terminase large subunit-like protein
MTVKPKLQEANDQVSEERQVQETDWTRTPATLANHISNDTWKMVPHLVYLADRIAECQVKPIFLIITIPPRHGKSELVSHWTTVWFLKKFPWCRVGLASYEMAFASEWGGKARNTIVENSEELGFTLTADTKAKGRWNIGLHGGGMSCSGIGGPITGRGFHLIIIDDPIKNDQEALSPVYRARNFNWWRSTMRPRAEPGASFIVIMTRWHEKDLAGCLLTGPEIEDETFEGIDDSFERDPWEVINLPAIAEDGDLMGRTPGEPLWPERYNLDALAKLRINSGPYWWAAQFRGKPQPEGGGIIKSAWFKYYEAEELPKQFSRIVQIWDTAYKAGRQYDRSACLTIGKAELPTRYYILDLFVRRMEYPELRRMAEAMYDSWQPERVGIEDKSSGISLIQQLRADTQVPIRAIKAVDDKITRAHTITGIVEAGQVLLPSRAPWLAEFLKEVGDFPYGAHDDITDTFVHGLRWLKATLGAMKKEIIHERKVSRWRM